MKQAGDRVENGIKAKVHQRILSVVDQSAAFIVKVKHSFAFDRMERRGIESVSEEMYEKILAYNFALQPSKLVTM